MEKLKKTFFKQKQYKGTFNIKYLFANSRLVTLFAVDKICVDSQEKVEHVNLNYVIREKTLNVDFVNNIYCNNKCFQYYYLANVKKK